MTREEFIESAKGHFRTHVLPHVAEEFGEGVVTIILFKLGEVLWKLHKGELQLTDAKTQFQEAFGQLKEKAPKYDPAKGQYRAYYGTVKAKMRDDWERSLTELEREMGHEGHRFAQFTRSFYREHQANPEGAIKFLLDVTHQVGVAAKMEMLHASGWISHCREADYPAEKLETWFFDFVRDKIPNQIRVPLLTRIINSCPLIRA